MLEMMGIQFAPYRFRGDQRGTDFRVAHDPEVRKSRLPTASSARAVSGVPKQPKNYHEPTIDRRR